MDKSSGRDGICSSTTTNTTIHPRCSHRYGKLTLSPVKVDIEKGITERKLDGSPHLRGSLGGFRRGSGASDRRHCGRSGSGSRLTKWNDEYKTPVSRSGLNGAEMNRTKLNCKQTNKQTTKQKKAMRMAKEVPPSGVIVMHPDTVMLTFPTNVRRSSVLDSPAWLMRKTELDCCVRG